MWDTDLRRDIGASGGRGGDAEGVATATSIEHGQTASASTRVFGGTGGEAAGWADFLPRGGEGGDAHGHALATSFGADSTVTVHGEAYGGQVGIGRLVAGGGHAGDGFSRSQGIALGDSTVVVTDRAGGGRGGSLLYGESLTEVGDGGAAHSSAMGSNKGARSVEVHASAFGAFPGETSFGNSSYEHGRGGDADASAVGESSAGTVTVKAEATAGPGGNASTAGAARADALAQGVAGSITAIATSQSFSGAITGIMAQSAANVDGLVHAFAAASMSAPLPAPNSVAGRQISAYGRGAPTVAEVTAALDGHGNNSAQFGTAGGERAFAMGQFELSNLDGASGAGIHTYSGQVDVWLNVFAKPGVTQHILLARKLLQIIVHFDRPPPARRHLVSFQVQEFIGRHVIR